MKALVAAPGGVVEVVEHPDPHPQAGGVVVAVHSCGICGSDVHGVQSGRVPHGHIPGHELSGTVVELGRDVSGWRVGQAVAVNPIGGCGSCRACKQGIPFICRAVPNLGINAPGGFAEYLAVPQAQLYALPEGVDTELGAHAEPLAVALHAIDLAQHVPGDDALVFGVGPIGLNVIVGLRAAGAGRIVAVGRSAGRRTAAAAVGADVVLDSRETDVAEYAAEAGLAFSAVYECSGAPEAVPASAPTLASKGTIAQLAFSSAPATVDWRPFISRNLKLVGSCAFGPRQYHRAVELLSSGAVDIQPLVSERVPLSAAPDAFQRLQQPGNLVGVVVQPGR